MKSSGSSQPGAATGVSRLWAWLVFPLAARVGGLLARAVVRSVRVRGVTMLISRPVAARASRKRSSAAARRMPRLRWAMMVERLAVPKHAAMVGNVGAVARWRMVASRWRP